MCINCLVVRFLVIVKLMVSVVFLMCMIFFSVVVLFWKICCWDFGIVKLCNMVVILLFMLLVDGFNIYCW